MHSEKCYTAKGITASTFTHTWTELVPHSWTKGSFFQGLCGTSGLCSLYLGREREEERHGPKGLGLGMEPRMTELRTETSAYETSAVPFGAPNYRGTTCARSKYRSQSSCFHKAKYFFHHRHNGGSWCINVTMKQFHPVTLHLCLKICWTYATLSFYWPT